jgi:HlyD family secretion protein
MHSQEKIFESRLDTINSAIQIEENKIHQLEMSAKAYAEMLSVLNQRIENFNKDLAAYQNIGKIGAAAPAQIRQVENQLGQSMHERIEIMSKINQMEDEILREKAQISNIKSSYLQESSKELRANMQDLVTVKEHFARADDKLERADIKAPVAGYVSNLSKIYTDGGVLQQVQPIMEIVPQDDVLVADVQINANDIDTVRIGQAAYVMIMPFKNRVVPKVKGSLVAISADAIAIPSSDSQPGYSVYHGRIEMDPKELEDVKKTKGVKLYPGMPVQAFIEIGPRTLLRYLLDPFLMSFDRAFGEV